MKTNVNPIHEVIVFRLDVNNHIMDYKCSVALAGANSKDDTIS